MIVEYHSYIAVYNQQRHLIGYVKKHNLDTNEFELVKDGTKAKDYKGNSNRLADAITTLRSKYPEYIFDVVFNHKYN